MRDPRNPYPVDQYQIDKIRELLEDRNTQAIAAEVISTRRLAVDGLLGTVAAGEFIGLLLQQPRKRPNLKIIHDNTEPEN